MAQKPKLTKKGLLAESFGKRPYRLTLREEKAGANVILDYSLAGQRKKPTLGYPVRYPAGAGWKWDLPALERARKAADERQSELKLDRLREEVKPQSLTVREAFRLFTDETKGGLPASASLRYAYLRSVGVWEHWLGADTPWNRILRTNVDAAMRHFAGIKNPRTGLGMIPAGLRYVEVLLACHHWLDKAGFEDLRDPTKAFDWKFWKDQRRPRRPRYTDDEAKALIRVRHDVDPRFALYLVLVDDSASRGKAVRTLWRSMVDCALDQPPTEDHAPHGWVVFPALKRQDPVLHFLTAFERRELDLAFNGYLSELEAEWQRTKRDYPLFPAVRKETLTDNRHVRLDATRAYRVVTPVGPAKWLAEAERVAKVPHVDGRLWHGFRRRASDYLMEATDLKTLTVAAGWKSERTPESIYVERTRHPSRARAREAMERRRSAPEDSAPIVRRDVGASKTGRNHAE